MSLHYCEKVECGKAFTRNPGPGRPAKYCEQHRDGARAPRPRLEKPELPDPMPEKQYPGKHFQFGQLVRVASARVPALLVGPAGTGKTTAAQQLAECLSLDCWEKPCHALMTDIDLIGYMTATGTYVPGIIRQAFESGGVVLIDEIDRSNPAVLVALNGIAATEIGQFFTFPDGARIPRHADFVLVAGANTWGDGASPEYVSAEQLDAATKDRFAKMEWPIDEKLERERARAMGAGAWCDYVQRVRRTVNRLGFDLLITPRATFQGAALIAAGCSHDEAAALKIWNGVDADTRRSVESALAGK